MVPGIKDGRSDSATIPSGTTINFEGPGRAGATHMQLTSLTVGGTLRGVSNAVPINIRTSGDINVAAGGHVGGCVGGTSRNNINLDAGGGVTVNGVVEGQRGAVSVTAGGNVVVGSGGRVQSLERSVGIVSRGGAVTVAAGGSVIAKQNVGVRAGPHQPVRVDGLVRSTNGNVVINGGLKQSQAGNVTVGAGGRIEAPNGEVIITADTLRVAGTIKGRTVQKKCNVVIIEPGGSIEGQGSEKDKIVRKEKVEPREDAAVPAQKAAAVRVTVGENAVIDYSGVLGTAVEAEVSVRLVTGPLGTLDLRGNPPGTAVIHCPGPIEIFAGQILLDPGVTPPDLCGPGPVLLGPGRLVADAGCLADPDTVVYPGLPGRASFIVSNLGNAGGLFNVSVFDPTGWGFGAPPALVWLDGGDDDVDTLTTVTTDIPPWAVPDIDTLRLRLRVSPVGDPLDMYEEEARMPLRPIDELRDVDLSLWGLDPAPAGGTALVQLWLANNGVLPDDYQLEVWDRDGWTPVPFDPLVVLPPAGETVRGVGFVVPPGLPNGTMNEVYARIRSLSSPAVMAADTFAVTVGAASAAPLPPTAGITHRSWPNPFNPQVTIAFRLPVATGAVAVAVYDLEGRKVRTLPDARLTGGQGLTAWDGRDDSGGEVASGVYVYRLRCGDLAAAGKVVLAR
jgi:hypothetical protein